MCFFLRDVKLPYPFHELFHSVVVFVKHSFFLSQRVLIVRVNEVEDFQMTLFETAVIFLKLFQETFNLTSVLLRR